MRIGINNCIRIILFALINHIADIHTALGKYICEAADHTRHILVQNTNSAALAHRQRTVGEVYRI